MSDSSYVLLLADHELNEHHVTVSQDEFASEFTSEGGSSCTIMTIKEQAP